MLSGADLQTIALFIASQVITAAGVYAAIRADLASHAAQLKDHRDWLERLETRLTRADDR